MLTTDGRMGEAGCTFMGTLESSGLRDGYAELGEVRLHYVEAGEGPLVVLIHGFPEFWFSWRLQIPALAGAGFHVVAPDMRGYNLSSRPAGVEAYGPDRVAADVGELIRELGADRAFVVGHDWGGWIAWATAINRPEVVERLAVLNAPHPRRFLRGLRRPRQLARSWYIFVFQLPWLPERLVRANGWAPFRSGLEHDARPGALTEGQIEHYVEAWSQPGAPTAMINYYRAGFRQARRFRVGTGRVQAPTLVIWGERDRYLGAELAEPDRADVPNLERVVRLPEASHWVQHDEPERVGQLLIEFFGGGTEAARS
jgi:pimeloyl-ACP methyl ester carboxylesterase